MKKKFLLLLLATILVLATFVSCGTNESEDYSSEYKELEEAGDGSIEYEVEETQDTKKIILTATYKIETKTFNDTVTNLENTVDEAGGYISESNVRPHQDGTTNSGSASFTIRIPSSYAESFKATLSGIGNVTSISISTEDVSLKYSDLQSRIETLKAEETSVRALLESADNIPDQLYIEERLTEISSELKSYEEQFKVLANKVDYATFYVYLSDVETYKVVDDPTYVDELGESFVNSFSSFVEVLGKILIMLVYLLPYALVAGGVVVLVIFINRKKKKNMQNQPKPTPKPQEYSDHQGPRFGE